MESKITIRQNPETKPVIKKPLTVDGKQVFNISELMLKRQSGKTLTAKEEQVLNDYLMHENWKKLTEKSKPLPTLGEVKEKMTRGEKLTTEETNVLLADIKKTEAEYAALRKQKMNMIPPMKDSVPKKPGVPPIDRYYVVQKAMNGQSLTPAELLALHKGYNKTDLKNDGRSISEYDPKRTAYRPNKNDIYTKKGGFERAMEKIEKLAEKKAELTEKGSKIADKFAKLLEYCKKYGKSFKA